MKIATHEMVEWLEIFGIKLPVLMVIYSNYSVDKKARQIQN